MNVVCSRLAYAVDVGGCDNGKVEKGRRDLTEGDEFKEAPVCLGVNKEINKDLRYETRKRSAEVVCLGGSHL